MTSLFGFSLALTSAFGEQKATFRTLPGSFLFGMRALLGNAELEPVTTFAPFFGAVGLIVFVIGMVFMLMNLFYSVMINALSDSKRAKGQRQSKDWTKNGSKMQDFGDAIMRRWQIKESLAHTGPGLAARWQKRLEARARREIERDEYENRVDSARVQVNADPQKAGFGFGRRRRMQFATAQQDDEDSIASDGGSEPDLGEKSGKLVGRLQQIDNHNACAGDENMQILARNNMQTLAQNTVEADDGNEYGNAMRDVETFELVLEATHHVVDNIAQHTAIAGDYLGEDMTEVHEVLKGIGNVMAVVSARTRNLENRQRQDMKRF